MPARTVADLLESSGVLPEIRSEEAWAEAVRGGLSAEALDAVMAAFGFTAAELERCVITRKSAQRRRSRHERLNADESARVARLARMALKAEAALGTAEKAAEWMRRRNRTLQGHSPLEMLDTDGGARMAEAVLAREERDAVA